MSKISYVTAFIVGLIVLLVMVACSPTNNTSDMSPDDHTTSFGVLCDTGRHLGMYIASYEGYHTGAGYSIRMTEEEYSMECRKYE